MKSIGTFVGGFVGYGGISGVTPTRGGTERMIKRCIDIYQKCGGDEHKGSKLREETYDGLSPFDAMKVVIHGKLRKTRETIKHLRNAGRQFSAFEKSKNDIRKMIRNIKYDYNKMLEYQKKCRERTFMQKLLKVYPENDPLYKARQEDIKNIKLHVDEVISLSNERYRNADYNKNRIKSRLGPSGEEKKKTKKLLSDEESSATDKDTDSDTDDDSEKFNSEDGEVELKKFDDIEIEINEEVIRPDIKEESEEDGEDDEDDPTKTKLVMEKQIDISIPMRIMRQKKKELDRILEEEFLTRLEVLEEMVVQIGDQLDEQAELLEEVDGKIEHNKERLKKLNEKVDKQLKQSKKGFRLIFFICCYICCTITLIIAYFVLLQTGVLQW